jgi:hypothetical protein
MIDLKKLYEKNCNTESDIYKHLPILHEYAKKCDHVTEMGAREGNSTSAFLYANPKKFVSYDYQYKNPEPHLEGKIKELILILESAKTQGINCEYIGADVLSIEIEETDLLFIDTWHCYEQLKRELELHGKNVRKYIIFHDTTLYGKIGEGYPHSDPNHPQKDNLDGSGGILFAIDEFLELNTNWVIEYQTEENCGIIVIANKLS